MRKSFASMWRLLVGSSIHATPSPLRFVYFGGCFVFFFNPQFTRNTVERAIKTQTHTRTQYPTRNTRRVFWELLAELVDPPLLGHGTRATVIDFRHRRQTGILLRAGHAVQCRRIQNNCVLCCCCCCVGVLVFCATPSSLFIPAMILYVILYLGVPNGLCGIPSLLVVARPFCSHECRLWSAGIVPWLAARNMRARTHARTPEPLPIIHSLECFVCTTYT